MLIQDRTLPHYVGQTTAWSRKKHMPVPDKDKPDCFAFRMLLTPQPFFFHAQSSASAGCGHPERVLHGGNGRLISQHLHCGHHHGSDAGHFCRRHRFLSTG